MKKKYICGAIIAAAILGAASFGMIGCNNNQGHTHTIEDRWSYDDYYHFHEASCGSVNHREDVGSHEGDECFCGWRADGQGGDLPDLGGESEFGAELTSSGMLTFDDIQGACKYVLSVTYAGESTAATYDIARGKTRVDLGSLRDAGFPSGKSTVELVAYEMYTEEIEGEKIEQEVPMDVKESFRVIKLNGEYSMRLLAFNDEYVDLDGFVPEKDENDNDVYAYEKTLDNNSPTSFNVSNYAKAASGCEARYYRSRTDRENDENALDRFALSTTKINSGKNMFYMRAVNGDGETRDYDLCVYGLVNLAIKRYDVAFTTDDDGLRTFTRTKIGDDIEITEREILTKEALYDGVADGKIARDVDYNIIEKTDMTVSAETADNYFDVYLYFYDETAVRADKKEYDKLSETFSVYDGEYGVSLVAKNDASGSITVPYIALGKRVVGATFGGGWSDNTTITEVKFEEGFTAFVGSFTQCMGVTDVYLPSTISYMKNFAFGGDSLNHIKSIPDTAKLHCSFSASYASNNFDSKWNYIVGTVSNRYPTVYDCDPVGGGSTETPSVGAGLYYRLDGEELTITGYDHTRFNGVIPDTAEYEGVTYDVTSIESFVNRSGQSYFGGKLVIGKNIATIAESAFADGYVLQACPTDITVAEGNTSFAAEDGVLYGADKTRVILTKNEGDLFLPDTVAHIDSCAIPYEYGRTIYLGVDSADAIDYEWNESNYVIYGVYKKTAGDFSFVVYTLGNGDNYSDYSDKPYAALTGYLGDGGNGNIVIPATVDGISVVEIDEDVLYRGEGFLADFEVTALSIPFVLTRYDATTILGKNGVENIESITLTGLNDSLKNVYDKNIYWLSFVRELPALADISIPDDDNYIVRDGVVYGDKLIWDDDGVEREKFEILYIASDISGAVTIVDGVEAVGGLNRVGFAGTAITSITLPSSVKTIGWGAFEGCRSLTTVTLSDGLTEIDEAAFKDCSALVKISLPSTVTQVGERAFWGCTSLTEVSLAATAADAVFAKTSGYQTGGVFAYCGKLKTLNFAGTKAQFEGMDSEARNGILMHSYILTVKCSDGDITVDMT